MNDAVAEQKNTLATTLRTGGLITGAVGLLVSVAGLLVSPEQFFRGYLVAYVFWVGVSLGCLALLMLHHLSAGGWGLVSQRHLEAGALTVTVMAILFVPLLFGLHHLYEWTHAEAVAQSAVLQHKKPYLNVPFFIGRAAIYFAFWIIVVYLLRRWSVRLDDTGTSAFAQRMRRLSAGGLVGHVLIVTFASVDWVMSLEPHWFSSIFGWLIAVSQTLTALAVTVLLLPALVKRSASLRRIYKTKHLHDYGNLTLVFVILWTYMMFAQFLIMWSGNIPEDIRWYVHRNEPPWAWIAPVLAVFHFAVPFAVLLSRRSKRSRRALGGLAGGLLVVHVLYIVWLVLPSFPHVGPHTYWIGAGALVGIGGLWGAAYAFFLGRRPLLPQRDPRFEAFYEKLNAARPEAAAGPP